MAIISKNLQYFEMLLYQAVHEFPSQNQHVYTHTPISKKLFKNLEPLYYRAQYPPSLHYQPI